MNSIHRALSELKTLDSRIVKTIEGFEPVGYKQVGKPVNGLYTEENFVADAKSKFDSINDLITRKERIKSAITKANNTVTVTIGGKQMTVADAINYKTILSTKKLLLDNLKRKNTKNIQIVERRLIEVEAKALNIASSALQKDNVKIGDNDVLNVTEPYIKNNKYDSVDPLDINKLIEKMEIEIDSFESEVDAVLSEVNAITMIEY